MSNLPSSILVFSHVQHGLLMLSIMFKKFNLNLDIWYNVSQHLDEWLNDSWVVIGFELRWLLGELQVKSLMLRLTSGTF